MAPYMTAPPAIHRHLDLVDSMALNMRARSRASRGPARAVFSVESRLAQRYEARVAAAADSFSVVAERDRAEPGLERAVVIPNGVDSDAFSYEEPDARPPTVLFFGNLGYFHNIRPATFLADEVVDRLRRAHEGASLLLAGARPAASVRRLAERDGVELLPDPPEMAPVLHSAAVVAIPMFSGSGMKNKVLEAFCAGTPVVANAAGIEGIDEAVPGEHFLLAEGAAATAEAIVGLLRDPAERVRLARAARDLAAEHYSWERAAERMLEAYGRSAVPRG
jgi:glycosyltransferase involved in cell wall biosynthesis